ncbi:hypothetical protein K402DRAFT_371720 [Aulographum hederae CBS 113979]|uniref:Fe2OG dioxygenase domain-containing protein n=1 Tax=Aulographum hederae CBS 113979 TaxID=1176131 RepID=A0A6G1H944_9PEZI|nr:hypothetical protein K402DRAFT_371720 [Aulographum hederae CBS 113979]
MSSFADLLAQKQPQFQTHQVLLVLGLQQDFTAPNGKLHVPNDSGYLDRLRALVPTFRERAGDIIWCRTVFETERAVNGDADGDAVILDGTEEQPRSSTDSVEESKSRNPSSSQDFLRAKSSRAFNLLKKVSSKKQLEVPAPQKASQEEEDELFLSRTSKREPCCMKTTPGAGFAADIQDLIDADADTFCNMSHYSAFNQSALLMTLRTKLVTELYICGSLTNISVYATSRDAVRHGFVINLVQDCLGYRKITRHQEALRQMTDLMGAYTTFSADIISKLGTPATTDGPGNSDVDTSQLQDMVRGMRLRSATPSTMSLRDKDKEDASSLRSTRGSFASSYRERPQNFESTSSRRRERDISELQAAAETSTEPSEALLEEQPWLRIPKSTKAPELTKRNYVKAPVRMRQRTRPREQGEPSSASSSRPRSIRKGPSPEKGAERSTDAAQSPPDDSSIIPTKESSSLPITQPMLGSHLAKEVEEALRRLPSKQPDREPPPVPSITTTVPSVDEPPRGRKPSDEASTSVTPQPSAMKHLKNLSKLPTLGPEDKIGEGDSRIVHDLLPATGHWFHDPANIFNTLYNEVRWQRMYHQTGEVPRLLCVQGEFGADGSMPVYRHPSDQSLPLLHFSAAVQVIRQQIEETVGHPVNHALIQLYRSGQDYISEHSDKTLDIVRGSSIVNASFGAQRTMRLRTKKAGPSKTKKSGSGGISTSPSNTQRIHMPHNSLFILGQETNKRWLHGINQDKRLQADRSTAELAFGGMRISLTFRNIGTFLSPTGDKIWGQGATAKKRDQAKKTINNDSRKTEQLVQAFGTENQRNDFLWDKFYGGGFDVLHFREPPPELPMLFLSGNEVADLQVLIYLEELGMKYTIADIPPKPFVDTPASAKSDKPKRKPIKRLVAFRDTDMMHTEVEEVVTVLFYLDRFYPLNTSPQHRATAAKGYWILLQVESMRRRLAEEHHSWANVSEILVERLSAEIVNEEYFAAGKDFSVADCAVWPLLRETVNEHHQQDEECTESGPRIHGKNEDGEEEEHYANLRKYCQRMAGRTSVVQARQKLAEKQKVLVSDKSKELEAEKGKEVEKPK